MLNSKGNIIAELRREAGYTQKTLAEALHITDKAVSKWERGLSLPDVSILPKLSLLLGADMSLLLAPDREAAMVFVFLGYYPIVQPCFSRIRRLWLQRAAKLIYFNCAIAVLYALLLFVIGAPALRGEFASLSAVLFAVILLLGNIAFYLCDLVLTRLTRVWHFRWRKKLLKKL